MGAMKNLLFAVRLPDAVETAFEQMIDDSLADAYFGASEPRRGPVDANHARNLLFEMWRELVHDDSLWSALARFLDLYATNNSEDA
jgi:hypothetical protein